MFGYSFHWRTVWQEIPQLAEGAIVTLQIAVFSMLIGITLAVLLAVARRNEGSIASRLASVWIEVARNTPCLLQIYLAYFGLGALGINISSYAAVLGAIAFNNAGYLAEILRGGFQLRAANAICSCALPRHELFSCLQLRRLATSVPRNLPTNHEPVHVGSFEHITGYGDRP